MAYIAGNLEAAIAAAAGDDPALLAELRDSFAHSFARQFDLLRRARCDGNWHVAARRLHGLGLSFHEEELSRLAAEALDGAPGDPTILRRIAAYAEKFSVAS